MTTYIHSPACFAAIITPLIEHSLRCLWCDVNNQQEDKIAKKGAYYVTLDGHGQREKHDLILMPYFGSSDVDGEKKENQLVSTLGGPAMALLTDMFASPCGGPNIRAVVAHGSWDAYWLSELSDDRVASTDSEDGVVVSPLEDVTCILLCVLCVLSDLCTSKRVCGPSSLNSFGKSYRPQFSYFASTMQDVSSVIQHLQALSVMFVSSEEQIMNVIDNQSKANQYTDKLTIPSESLIRTKDQIWSLSGNPIDPTNVSVDLLPWTSENVYREYECNVKLATCGSAPRTLLKDIVSASSLYTTTLANLYLEYQKGKLTSRQTRRFLNLASISKVTLTLYSFTGYVALLLIRKSLSTNAEGDVKGSDFFLEGELLKAVERSRMCVSTFSTFSLANIDRALKAVDTFVCNKYVKKVVKYALLEDEFYNEGKASMTKER